ncbi:hypothetical protein [Carboxydocella sp. JDF658]|uniref:hypothetical protein n=1 Tax=Carboxydocella sp. JDF658 TaxID=1926600 RepID=UPI0009AC8C44|nr:hypothetical protein [Carboxydocella sp. JDF658]GAW32023.1 hypothetical protein JDF658_17880 [Carboxydocella sp. JDF658]
MLMAKFAAIFGKDILQRCRIPLVYRVKTLEADLALAAAGGLNNPLLARYRRYIVVEHALFSGRPVLGLITLGTPPSPHLLLQLNVFFSAGNKLASW